LLEEIATACELEQVVIMSGLNSTIGECRRGERQSVTVDGCLGIVYIRSAELSDTLTVKDFDVLAKGCLSRTGKPRIDEQLDSSFDSCVDHSFTLGQLATGVHVLPEIGNALLLAPLGYPKTRSQRRCLLQQML
jgi:hypothetical protein